METATIIPKFHVVIPQSAHEAMNLVPGEKLRVLQFGDRVELIRVRETKNLRDALAGMDTAVERDFDRI